MRNCLPIFCLVVVAGLLPSQCSGQAILFRDEMVDPNGWGMNISPDSDVSATFGYDYSTIDGIPEAPHSEGGDVATSGVKLEANNGDFSEVVAYFTLYPLGQNFTGKYMLRFDAWMNYDLGELLDGAAVGTTEFLGGGIGYDNVTADVASGAQAITTGDGGSASDWRAFKSPPQFFIPAADMSGGSLNAGVAYYADFLLPADPPAPQGQSASGSSPAGSPGFQWITWETKFDGSEVVVTVEKPGGERLEIVRYDPTDLSDGSSGVDPNGNISIFYADFFDSLTARPDLTFGVVDNVVVSEVGIPGDFDGDDDVDGEDFLKWQRGESDDPFSAGDLAAWEGNYGTTPLSAAITRVPEPASMLLMLGAAQALLWRSTRRGFRARRWVDA